MSSAVIEAPQASLKKVITSHSSSGAQRLLDVRLERLRDTVLPHAPYIMTADHSIPSTYLKQAYPLNANDWQKNTLFQNNERPLQYVTFKDRSSDSSIRGLTTHGGWDDGKGSIAVKDEATSRTSSDGTPRPGQGPKKKITLADYSNSLRTKPRTAESKAADSMVDETKKVEGKAEERTAPSEDKVEPRESQQSGIKRSADTMKAFHELQAFETAPIAPSAKKARTTPEPEKTAPKETQKAQSAKVTATAEKSDPKEAPRTVNGMCESPELDEARSLKVTLKLSRSKAKAAQHGLPPMLSPLSSDIEEALAKRSPTPSVRGNLSSAEKSKIYRHSRAPTPSLKEKNPASKTLLGIVGIATSTPTKEPQEPREITSAPRQGSKNLGLSNAAPRNATFDTLTNGTSKLATTTVRATVPVVNKNMRLRVALRLKKKANRRTLQQYLSLKPTPGKYPAGIQAEVQVENSVADASNNKPKDGLKQAEPEPLVTGKRRRFSNEGEKAEPPAKRQQVPGPSQQNMHTPKQSMSSPCLSHLGSAQKARLATPEAGPTSTPMMRGASGNSSIHTPHQQATSGTPVSQAIGTSRITMAECAVPKAKASGLSTETQRLLDLAIGLKHDADKYLRRNTSEAASDHQRRHGVVVGLEAALCFMLAFTVSEGGRSNGGQINWKTIPPYLSTVSDNAKGFRHLCGLARQIESAVRDTIAYTFSQRLAKGPQDDCFLDKKADGAKTAEQHRMTEYYFQFSEFKRNDEIAQNMMRESWAYLNLEEIREKFPDNWARREEVRPPVGKGQESIKVGDYERRVVLPLSSAHSTLEAVNYGFNILTEFCRNEGVDWKPKLVL